MKITLFALVLMLAISATAQSRVEVLRIFNLQTNICGASELTIHSNQVARIVDFRRTWPNAYLQTTYPQGLPMLSTNAALVVAGPCTLALVSTGFIGGSNTEAVAVVELTAQGEFPVQKTSILPAGYAGHVALETSANLADWQQATNGPLPAGELHRFFRVKLVFPASP